MYAYFTRCLLIPWSGFVQANPVAGHHFFVKLLGCAAAHLDGSQVDLLAQDRHGGRQLHILQQLRRGHRAALKAHLRFALSQGSRRTSGQAWLCASRGTANPTVVKQEDRAIDQWQVM